jgi:molybdate/tungstate transport system substrate-binding protein
LIIPLSIKNNVIILVVFLSYGICSISLIYGLEITEGPIYGQGKVFVMYAGSFVKIFESLLGSSFQNETGYTYVGEGKGSVQIANLIVDGFRKPDIFVSTGTIPIMELMDKNLLLHNG